MVIVVIGGTGHIGTYLVPRLVTAGHEVICVSRQARTPYRHDPLWNAVRMVQIDRESAEASGSFASQIRALRAEVVIDLICFTPASARALVEALSGHVKHFIHCGTIWVH